MNLPEQLAVMASQDLVVKRYVEGMTDVEYKKEVGE